ncbi:MAG: hypothetical protein EOO73_05550 [Myxococcales bacterium]|nr:MAG: hypothetical protein EOO73_05550 [Myxococcales bacterium]
MGAIRRVQLSHREAECRVPSAECRVPSAECRVPSAECRGPGTNDERRTTPVTSDKRFRAVAGFLRKGGTLCKMSKCR